MGVYINGMGLPISCERCPMLDWDLDYIKCKITDRHFKMTECWRAIRVPDCPLVPVPPHGDLIEREKLVFEDDIYGWRDKQVVKAAPTIIPASNEGE